METYIEPIQDTTTQRRSQPSHGQIRWTYEVHVILLSTCMFLSLKQSAFIDHQRHLCGRW